MCLFAGCVSTVTPSDAAEVSAAVKLSGPKALPVNADQNEDQGSVQVHESSWALSARADSCYTGFFLADPCCNSSYSSAIYGFTTGINYSRFKVAEATRGGSFEAVFMSTSPAVQRWGLTFLNENDDWIDADYGGTLGKTSVRLEGLVPATASTAIAWSCLTGPVSFRYEAQMQSASPMVHGVDASWLVGTKLRAGYCYIGMPGPISYRDPATEGITHTAFEVPAETQGAKFKISAYHVVDTVDPSIVVTFFDGAGRHLSESWGYGPLIGNIAVGDGVVPPNAAHARLWSCVSGPVVATYRASGEP